MASAARHRGTTACGSPAVALGAAGRDSTQDSRTPASSCNPHRPWLKASTLQRLAHPERTWRVQAGRRKIEPVASPGDADAVGRQRRLLVVRRRISRGARRQRSTARAALLQQRHLGQQLPVLIMSGASIGTLVSGGSTSMRSKQTG